MKEKLVRWSRHLLNACLLFGAWVTIDIASIILFGEYEYPIEKQSTVHKQKEIPQLIRAYSMEFPNKF